MDFEGQPGTPEVGGRCNPMRSHACHGREGHVVRERVAL